MAELMPLQWEFRSREFIGYDRSKGHDWDFVADRCRCCGLTLQSIVENGGYGPCKGSRWVKFPGVKLGLFASLAIAIAANPIVSRRFWRCPTPTIAPNVEL